MTRLRGIVVFLFALVLVTAQIATGLEAGAMALTDPADPSAVSMVMDDGGMSGDCDDCPASDAGSGLCFAPCCAACGATAAVVPGHRVTAPDARRTRSVQAFRLSLGLSPAPWPTPPKHGAPS